MAWALEEKLNDKKPFIGKTIKDIQFGEGAFYIVFTKPVFDGFFLLKIFNIFINKNIIPICY